MELTNICWKWKRKLSWLTIHLPLLKSCILNEFIACESGIRSTKSFPTTRDTILGYEEFHSTGVHGTRPRTSSFQAALKFLAGHDVLSSCPSLPYSNFTLDVAVNHRLAFLRCQQQVYLIANLPTQKCYENVPWSRNPYIPPSQWLVLSMRRV